MSGLRFASDPVPDMDPVLDMHSYWMECLRRWKVQERFANRADTNRAALNHSLGQAGQHRFQADRVLNASSHRHVDNCFVY
jgi:hypothetical protein